MDMNIAAVGEQLYRSLIAEISACNWPEVEAMFAPGFQSVHADGARDRATEIQTIKDEKDDYRACITKGKTASKQNLDAALKTVKKPNAKEALKTYHVALVSALEGINPGSDERKINYEQRQQNLEGKMTEAWARFEIEQ